MKSAEEGQTLLSFLRAQHLKEISVKGIKRLINGKQCKVNGRVETFSTYKVKVGDEITLAFKDLSKPLDPLILFEDDRLLVWSKPAGRTSDPPDDLYSIHRLDKETTGVLLIGKTETMAKTLIDAFRNRLVEKRYLVLCDGTPKHDTWTIDNHLAKKVSYQGGGLWGRSKDGKRAITHFEVIARGKTSALLEAKPVTGRTHQIRVHLSEGGHPVLGDWQYGRTFKCPIQPERHMLHAHKLAIPSLDLHFEAPIPDDFEEAEKAALVT